LKTLVFVKQQVHLDKIYVSIKNGAVEENRTLDLTLTKGALYH
jgi:hypothetical protein